jgi:uncharacterized protein (DUF433 family)
MSKNLLDRITLNPQVCNGRPTIRNSRYTVDLILELLSTGMTIDEILDDYSGLEKEDVLACLLYASMLSKFKSIQKVA